MSDTQIPKAISFQTKSARKLRKLRKKLLDNKLKRIGLDLELFVLTIENNKYEDETLIELTDTKTIFGYIDYPGEEIPITNKFGNNNSTLGFHLYDILPIEFYCRLEDNIKVGDLIIHKILMPDDTMKALSLQVVDRVARADTDFIFQKFILAPYTFDMNNIENSELKNVIEDYISKPLIEEDKVTVVPTTPYDDEY
jgi:hypothetical protein